MSPAPKSAVGSVELRSAYAISVESFVKDRALRLDCAGVPALLDADPKAAAAAPKIVFPDGRICTTGIAARDDLYWFDRDQGNADDGARGPAQEVLGVSGCCALFRVAAWRQVGGQDEAFHMYYEDVDWALRAHLSGHVTAFVPDAVATHEHAASTRSFGERRRYRLVQRNLLLCATANLSWRSVLSIWMGRFVAHGKALIKGPDHWSGVVSLLTAAAHTPSALCARRARRAAAILPDTDVFAFADGLTPFVDATAYRPDGSDAARRAAEARQAQARGRR